MKRLLTLKEFQDDYGISRTSVFRLRKRQELKVVRIGRAIRIRVEDAEAWSATLPNKAPEKPSKG